MSHDIWQLGAVVADLATQRIHRDGREFRLTPRAVAMLRALIEAGDRPLSRDAALDRIWSQVATGDEVVGKAVNELRLALGDLDAGQRRYIETIPKLGYRLICTRTPLAAVATPVPAPASVVPEPAPAPVAAEPVAAAAPLPRRRPWLGVVVAASLAFAAAIVYAGFERRGATGPYAASALRTALAAPLQVLTPAAGYMGYADVLPDGSRALFAAPSEGTVRVFAQTLADRSTRRLGDLPDGADFALAVAHDGRRVAYQHFGDDGRCRIRLHTLADASERDVGGCSTRFAEWLEFTPDGRALLTPRMRPGDTAMSLHRIDLADGSVAPVDYPRDPRRSDVQARHSPDGRWLAIRRGPQPHSALVVLDLERRTLRELVDADTGLDGYAWLPDSRGLVIGVHAGAEAGLWRVDLAGARREFLGRPGATDPVIAAREGSLLFCLGTRRYGLARQALDARPEPKPAQPWAGARGSEWYPRLAPDGAQLAFLSDRDGPVAVYVAAAAGGAPRRLPAVPDYVPDATPAFAPDGRSLVVPMRTAQGTRGVFEADLASGRWSRLPLAPAADEVWVGVDNKWIYYVAPANGRRDLWRHSRETGVQQAVAADLERGPLAGDAQGALYYIDAGQQALLRRDADGQVTRRLEDMGYWSAYAWTVAGDTIYALLEPAGKGFGLYALRGDAAPVLVAPMDGVAALGLAVRAAQGELLIARPPPAAHDLVRVALGAPAR